MKSYESLALIKLTLQFSENLVSSRSGETFVSWHGAEIIVFTSRKDLHSGHQA